MTAQFRRELPSTTMETAEPLVARFGNGEIIFETAPDDWILPLIERICELGSLGRNWNSYGAQEIRADIAAKTIVLLLNLLSPDDPKPAVVPTSRGGILLEWHEAGIDLEVDVRSPSWIHLAFDDGTNQEELDRTSFEAVGNKLDLLRRRIK